MQKTLTKFRSCRVTKKLEPLHIPENSFNEKFENNIDDAVEEIDNDEKNTEQDNHSDAITVKRRSTKIQELHRASHPPSEQNLIEMSQVSNQLEAPYQFIGVSSPSLRTIILPHFSFKTITFAMSVTMLIMFLAIFIIHQMRPQTPTSWGCMLFETQNKFYARLRSNYEVWRVPVSGLFHSNFSHLILNLVGLQLYAYFIEWYLGKFKFVGLVIISIINSHLMSCLTNKYTVSTTSSGILYAILGVKILFFIKYRNYQQLSSKKYALYGLLGLIFAINLIVLFTGSNVDVGGHLGGLMSGLVYGGIFYEQSGKGNKVIRYSLMVGLVVLCLGLIGGCLALPMSDVDDINNLIDNIC